MELKIRREKMLQDSNCLFCFIFLWIIWPGKDIGLFFCCWQTIPDTCNLGSRSDSLFQKLTAYLAGSKTQSSVSEAGGHGEEELLHSWWPGSTALWKEHQQKAGPRTTRSLVGHAPVTNQTHPKVCFTKFSGFSSVNWPEKMNLFKEQRWFQ